MKGRKSGPPGRNSILTHEQALDKRRQLSEDGYWVIDGVPDQNLLGELRRTVSRALRKINRSHTPSQVTRAS